MFLKLSLADPDILLTATVPDFILSSETGMCIFGSSPQADWHIPQAPPQVARITFVKSQFHLRALADSVLFVNHSGKPLSHNRAIALRDNDELQVGRLKIEVRIGEQKHIGRKLQSLESMLRTENSVVEELIEGASHSTAPERETAPQDPLALLEQRLPDCDTLDPLAKFMHSRKQSSVSNPSAPLEDLVMSPMQVTKQAFSLGNQGHGMDAVSIPKPSKDKYGFEEITEKPVPVMFPKEMAPETISAYVSQTSPDSPEEHAQLCWERYRTLYNQMKKEDQ